MKNMKIEEKRLKHMTGVAQYMMERASAYDLNGEQMYALGLLHDIGYIEGAEDHEKRGAEILAPIIKNEQFLYAIANHGRELEEIEKETNGDGIFPEFVLLVEADMTIDIDGDCVGFQERLADIIKRHGLDSEAAKNSMANMEYVGKYCKKNNIVPVTS